MFNNNYVFSNSKYHSKYINLIIADWQKAFKQFCINISTVEAYNIPAITTCNGGTKKSTNCLKYKDVS